MAQFIDLVRNNPEFSLFLHQVHSLEIFEQLAHSAGLAMVCRRWRGKTDPAIGSTLLLTSALSGEFCFGKVLVEPFFA